MKIRRKADLKNLPGVKLDERFFRYRVASMQSEKYLTFLDRENSSMVTIQPDKNFQMVSKRISESCSIAAMHPTKEVVALCSSGETGRGVYIYNLACKSKMKQIDLKEEVLFARWVGECFAFLTEAGIYHLELESEKESRVSDLPTAIPELVKFQAGQIVGYCKEGPWSTVFTIYSLGEGKM